MSLGPITLGTDTYVETSRGRYINSIVPFGGPRDEIKITPGTLAAKAKPPVVTAGISRLFEVPVTLGDGTSITRRAVVNLTFSVEPGVTADVIDELLAQISLIATEPLLNQVLNGAS